LIIPCEWQGTLVDRIDEIAQAYSQDPALKDGLGNSLTYSQMNARVNTIAASLSSLGLGEKSKVGVFQEASTYWVCSMLAILRLGAIYVPLDPGVTTMRLAMIIKDCDPDAILTDNAYEKDFPLLNSPSTMVNVSKLSFTTKQRYMPNSSQEDDIMTILYTSGSTGTPKGILMKHSIFRDHVETVTNTWISKHANTVGLQQSSFGFDMSLVQIFWPLCSGGSVYIVPQSARGDSIAISSIISSERISITAATPSEYISWIQFGEMDALRKSSWALGISGGEKITENLTHIFRALNKQGFRLMNCYGPTEITFFSHFSEMSFKNDSLMDQNCLSLKPWSNYSTYIIDSNNKPVPAGIPGEVVIGGMGVASGYLNMKEKTNERFLLDNFASDTFIAQGWNMMHRTGDRGRLQPDGSLLLEGRIVGDTQIKLRGLRIDLQDIETTIISSSLGQLLHAVVSLRRSQLAGSEFLVAHAEFSPSHSPKNKDAFIKNILLKLPLPQYMRPATIIPVKRLPRTNSGKIDRLSINALPLPEKHQNNESPQSFNDTESQLLKLWEEILTKDILNSFTIDSHSDFFQVGGSSLLLVQLQALIKKTFSVDLPLVQLFDVSILGHMASRINDLGQQNVSMPSSQNSETVADTAYRQSTTKAFVHVGVDVPHSPSLSASTTHDSIDWEAEVALPSSLEPSYVLGANEPRVVILTGSTGFLGKVLLQRLVNIPSIEKIYCIAVRSNSSRADPVFSSPKVLVYTGDQSFPLLGLSPPDAQLILSDADTIIHNGADVSFLKTYSSLRKPNVESTKQLAEWAVVHGLQFHYISTSSVIYLSGQQSYPSISVRNFKPPLNGSNGYIASKWASEVYLERMNLEFGMPLVIHRPSSITGPGASETDVMSSLLKYSKILHAIPKSDYIKGYFDFISLNNVADEIIELVQRGIEDVGARYVFESGEVQIAVEGMKSSLEMQTGEDFVELGIPEWIRRAEILGLNGMVAAFLQSASTQGLLMTRLVKG